MKEGHLAGLIQTRLLLRVHLLEVPFIHVPCLCQHSQASLNTLVQIPAGHTHHSEIREVIHQAELLMRLKIATFRAPNTHHRTVNHYLQILHRVTYRLLISHSNRHLNLHYARNLLLEYLCMLRTLWLLQITANNNLQITLSSLMRATLV